MNEQSEGITLPAEARPYVLYQRTELIPVYKTSLLQKFLKRMGFDDGYKTFVKHYAESENINIDIKYSKIMKEKSGTLLPHIPKTVKSIVDIGCGIAALDVFLYNELESPRIFLVDRTEIEDRIWYNLKPDGAFYNSLELARDVLVMNGVNIEDVYLKEAPADGNLEVPEKSIDLVISTISWGFHYPVSVYLKSVFEALSDNGILIIDIRNDTGGETELRSMFEINQIAYFEKYVTYKCIKK